MRWNIKQRRSGGQDSTVPFFRESEQYMNTNQWLKYNGLEALSLTIPQVLDQQVHPLSSVRLRQLLIKWKDHKKLSINSARLITKRMLLYEDTLVNARHLYRRRLKWLNTNQCFSASRAIFGNISGDCVMFVIDTCVKERELSVLKQAFKDMISHELQEKSRRCINIIEFGDDVRVWRSSSTRVNRKNVANLLDFINCMECCGGEQSNMLKAMEAAYSDLDVDTIFLVCSNPPQGMSLVTAVSAIFRFDGGRGIPINTISFDSTYVANTRFLERLSTHTNGVAIRNRGLYNPDDLPKFSKEDTELLKRELQRTKVCLSRSIALRRLLAGIEWCGGSGNDEGWEDINVSWRWGDGPKKQKLHNSEGSTIISTGEETGNQGKCDHVIARWDNDGYFYPAKVEKYLTKNFYLLSFDTGVIQVTSRNNFITEEDKSHKSLPVGCRVLACLRDSSSMKYQPAVVERIGYSGKKYILIFSTEAKAEVARDDIIRVLHWSDSDWKTICMYLYARLERSLAQKRLQEVRDIDDRIEDHEFETNELTRKHESTKRNAQSNAHGKRHRYDPKKNNQKSKVRIVKQDGHFGHNDNDDVVHFYKATDYSMLNNNRSNRRWQQKRKRKRKILNNRTREDLHSSRVSEIHHRSHERAAQIMLWRQDNAERQFFLRQSRRKSVEANAPMLEQSRLLLRPRSAPPGDYRSYDIKSTVSEKPQIKRERTLQELQQLHHTANIINDEQRNLRRIEVLREKRQQRDLKLFETRHRLDETANCFSGVDTTRQCYEMRIKSQAYQQQEQDDQRIANRKHKIIERQAKEMEREDSDLQKKKYSTSREERMREQRKLEANRKLKLQEREDNRKEALLAIKHEHLQRDADRQTKGIIKEETLLTGRKRRHLNSERQLNERRQLEDQRKTRHIICREKAIADRAAGLWLDRDIKAAADDAREHRVHTGARRLHESIQKRITAANQHATNVNAVRRTADLQGKLLGGWY